MILLSSGHSRSAVSVASLTGSGEWQLSGRYDSNSLIFRMQSSSFSVTTWHTPLLEACATAPPRSSCETSSPITALITSGPVMYMYEVFFTMKIQSVRAGEYTAPPAVGPIIAVIWGI